MVPLKEIPLSAHNSQATIGYYYLLVIVILTVGICDYNFFSIIALFCTVIFLIRLSDLLEKSL